MNLSLFPHQQEAVDLFFKNGGRGSILFATGMGKTETATGIIKRYIDGNFGKVLFLAPTITLVEQTCDRFTKYGIKSGMFYSLKKDLTEMVTISTYQSISNNLDLLHNFNLVVFDEAHLCSLSARKFSEIVKVCQELKKDMLSLTATLDTTDKKNEMILDSCPIITRIELCDAIERGFLTPTEIINESVDLSIEDKRKYDIYSDNIRNLSNILGTSNLMEIAKMTELGGERGKLAGAWFKNVGERKKLMEMSNEKIEKVLELLTKTNGEQTIIFTERIDTLKLLKEKLGDKFEFISAKTKKKDRLEILANFGKTFNIIGTVHTLDLGYDVPNIRHGIIIASNKNQNTIVQRIGRVVRKSEGKSISKVYVVYARNTHEESLYQMIKNSVNSDSSVE